MKKPFVIYTANCCGHEDNCMYPHRCEITCAEEFQQAVRKDYVCAEYTGNYRSSSNFCFSNVLAMDNDNDHTEAADQWVTPEDIAAMLPGVPFFVHYSRHHMKPKEKYSARPRYHVAFLIDDCRDSTAYAAIKKRLHERFAFFDNKALDAARFFFGTAEPEVEYHDGDTTLNACLDTLDREDAAAEEFLLNMGAGGHPIYEGSRNSTMSVFAARVLKRLGDTDEARHAFDERAACCTPPLDDAELMKIWNSALRFYKKISCNPGYIPPEQYEATTGASSEPSWDEPLPIGEENMPDFPIEALPEALRNYAVAIGQSTQTSVDMAAVGCLTTASACMRNLYKVEGKPDWHEPTNIYSVIIAEPSERKSAVTSLVTKPVDEYIREYNDAHKVDFEMSKATKQRLENRKNNLLSQSKKKGETTAAVDFDDALRSVVEELVNYKEVKPLKVYVDDTTPEKLTETIAENGGAVAIISSEGGIFDVLSGTYSNKVNIDVFLKAYSGEHISVERIMRQPVSVDEACLTILLSVQPVVIGELMSNKKFRHRGLTARFLYTTPKSLVGSRSLDSASIPPETYMAYKTLIYNILSETRNGKAEIIRLTPEARNVLSTYYDWVEKRMTGEFSMYADWLGKLVGNTLRIAGILARCGCIRRNAGEIILECDASLYIDAKTMENAIRIGKYFLIHAVGAYGDMGVRSDFKAALTALEKIKERKLTSITRRDIMRFCRWIGSAEEAQSILNNLEDYGYVRLVSIDASDRLRNGRPKNAVYAVNPFLYK